MRNAAILLPAVLALAGCATAGSEQIATYQPPAGSTEVLRGEIAAAPGHQLVVGDLVGGPGMVIPRHYHHGEELIYVIGGSATLSRPGLPDLVLGPGEGFRIPPGTVHWGLAGPAGVRAVTSWVLPEGQPLRVAVPAD